MLIQQGFFNVPQYNNVSIPLGIEYERLSRELSHRLSEKYHIIDRRKKIRDNNKVLSPGYSNLYSNQTSITFEEPYTKATYPIENIPYSQGLIWED